MTSDVKRRSKTGCKTCRSRKRKCDEIHPICDFCRVRGLNCQYEIKVFTSSSFKIHKPTHVQQQNILDSTTDLIPLTPELHFPEPTYSPTFNIDASSPLMLYLDDKGLGYIKNFERIAGLLSLSQKTNYIKNTFLTLAFSNEAISNLLAAWGAAHTGDTNETERYLTLAKSLIRSTPRDRFDYFATFATYLIQMAIYIHRGDTKKWFEIFKSCETLVRNYGGLMKFVRDFSFSNDCKFLISNFQFYDVMSSESLERGTTCTMQNYHSLFRSTRLLLEGDYGVDPYQGCCQPIYLLLGEIMNTYVELKNARKDVLQQEDPVVRVQYYKQVEEKIVYLSTCIEECSPGVVPEDEPLQMELFELCRIVGRMYVSLYIKQTQPKSSEIQLLLHNAMGIMDKLLTTKLGHNLNMALLMCGITAVNKYDRANIDAKFRTIHARHSQGNLERIWEVVKESWVRNPQGNTCIDWLDICHDFDWKISMI
ncbi:hypothetical protein SBY92_000697 [Candida maltosa Xu316]